MTYRRESTNTAASDRTNRRSAMRNVVIVSAVRTAIGSFGGSLAGFSAVELGSFAAKEAMERAGISPEIVEEVIIGNVLSSGLGQNVARQVAMTSGVPKEVPAMTINKVCGSGLRSVTLAAQIIKAGDAEIILAGGTESMSNAPYLLPKARFGYKMGDQQVVDSIISDGLSDAFDHLHMGMTAEKIAEQWGITREEQDAFAAASQQKAETAIKSGRFIEEIVPIMIPQRKGEPVPFDTDEFPRFGTTPDTLSKLRPAFKKDGSVTAGNASGVNDGAAMLVLMSEDKARELGLKPMARIVSYASEGLDPTIMGYGPVAATKKALVKGDLQINQIDLIEANEAFAVQSLAVARDLGFDPMKVNVNGGAIALGHPIGASGARILTTLLYEMKRQESGLGLATLCIGGGQGIALVIENLAR